MAFDDQGRLYVAASLAGRKGVVRIDPERNLILVQGSVPGAPHALVLVKKA